jgi:hypothetical protein
MKLDRSLHRSIDLTPVDILGRQKVLCLVADLTTAWPGE